jgi:hypothetical protein
MAASCLLARNMEAASPGQSAWPLPAAAGTASASQLLQCLLGSCWQGVAAASRVLLLLGWLHSSSSMELVTANGESSSELESPFAEQGLLRHCQLTGHKSANNEQHVLPLTNGFELRSAASACSSCCC